jgi:hypothetical protein
VTAVSRELALQVAYVAHGASGAELAGHVQGVAADGAGAVDFALSCVGGSEQCEVEGSAAYVSVVHL